eukprot:8813335-Alexandrium_andersonii.AAC.1
MATSIHCDNGPSNSSTIGQCTCALVHAIRDAANMTGVRADLSLELVLDSLSLIHISEPTRLALI